MVLSTPFSPNLTPCRSRAASTESDSSFGSVFEQLHPAGSSVAEPYRRNSKLLSYHHVPSSADDDKEESVRPWRACCISTVSTDMPGVKELRPVVQVINLFKSILRVHGMGLLGVIGSFLVCWICGALHASLVDVSFFKSTGLLLAVMLSVRARNAMSRRTDLMNQILSMINSAKTILDMAGSSTPEKRRILSQALGVSFAEVALWLTRHCTQEYAESISVTKDWLRDTLAQLPTDHKRNFLRLGCINALGISPRPLILYLRDVCDELFIPEPTQGGEIDKISNIRRWHKNIDRELQLLIDFYDDLCLYLEDVHTKEFKWLISFLIFCYVALYPWCVDDERKLILGSTTILMATVFYGLDAMAQELEEPLGPHSQGLNVALTFRQTFAEIGGDEQARARFTHFLDSHDEDDLSLDLRAEFSNAEIFRQLEDVYASPSKFQMQKENV